MSDHDATVAAVLVDCLRALTVMAVEPDRNADALAILAGFTAAGYAVMKVPEGVEERKALAKPIPFENNDHERNYPNCCVYHEGFDDALSLVTDMVYEGRRFYAIEAPKVTP